ncbi:MAG: hypothetical protein PSX81_04280 [bacterium]|nr:hypothetical protein [bacterium]
MTEEQSTRKKILENKFLPLILMALNLSFFFYFIPDHVAESYSTFLAILGGVITMVLAFWIALFVLPKVFDAAPIFMALLCMSSLFVFGYLFIVKTSDFSANELSKYGVLTNAVIVDKTQLYGRRGKTIQSMEVQFTTQDAKSVTAKILLSEGEYERFQEGMQVPITYSSKHPEIVGIAYSKMKQ